jgi:DNA polymerase beta
MSNTTIIDEFNKLAQQIKFNIETSNDDKIIKSNDFRLKQTKNIIRILKKYNKKIVNDEQLDELIQMRGIGKGTIVRIKEILDKGKLKEIKSNKKQNLHLKYLYELEQVINIGPKKAQELVNKYKIKSVNQLKKEIKLGKITVNDKIKLGLKYHNKYKQNIPRTEIDSINTYLHTKYPIIDTDLFGIICGSYRRKNMVSNDVDVLIIHPKIKTMKKLKNNNINYLKQFVNLLKEDKFLTDDLTDKNIETKYMGFCKYKSSSNKKYYHRRIDIRYIPYESYYSALLYFTGSGELNQVMRSKAQSMGYILNEYGLYKLNNDKKKKIKVNSEKDIFDKLEIEFISPDKR